MTYYHPFLNESESSLDGRKLANWTFRKVASKLQRKPWGNVFRCGSSKTFVAPAQGMTRRSSGTRSRRLKRSYTGWVKRQRQSCCCWKFISSSTDDVRCQTMNAMIQTEQWDCRIALSRQDLWIFHLQMSRKLRLGIGFWIDKSRWYDKTVILFMILWYLLYIQHIQ